MNEQDQSPLLHSVQELRAFFENKRSSMTEDQASPISEAIDSLVASIQALRSGRDGLARIHSQLSLESSMMPENVIPFRRPLVHQTPAISVVNDKRWILKIDCLIESQHISEIHKMAMELHSHSRRYAFLEFRDLDSDTRQSLPGLLKLGALTIFIPSLLDLSISEQSTLFSLVEEQTLNRPLLMVGSTQPYAELRAESTVHTELLATLSRAYIKLTRPFSEYKEQGLIHYFLDSLSESPT